MVLNPTFWLLVALGPILHWIVPARWRAWMLAAISMGYVASISTWGLVALVLLMLAAWRLPALTAGGGSRSWIRATIVLLIGYLAFFKYLPELAAQIAPQSWFASLALPVGISFFTFKLIHVAVEIARGKLADRSPATFAAYVFLFPTFTAGPIEQYDHFLAHRAARFDPSDVIHGLWRILVGLVKKFVIADVILRVWVMKEVTPDSFLYLLETTPLHKAWGYLFATFVYGYFDFAGYSDIAIGASRLFGLRIMENFDNPMMSRNIAEFWKRWHMSLAAWTQRYVYMPMLGWTRNPWVGIYATFLAMGVWHAGNVSFVGWGLYHATGVSAALLVQRVRRSRGGRPFAVIDRIPRWGTALTWMFLAGSAAFAVTSGRGPHALLRVGAKLVGVDVPVGDLDSP